MSTIRAALTQTRNAYEAMPGSAQDLHQLAGRLDELREANLAHHRELVADAAAGGAQILCLGELFPAPYFALHRDPMWLDLAEDATHGPSVQAMRAAAREHGLILIAPIYELDAVRGKRFNTAVVLDEQGEILGKYRKTHIPRGSNETAAFSETDYYEPSDGQLDNGPADLSANPYFPVFSTSVGKIGVATCYDRHFSGSVRSLALAGASLVFSPAVTFGAKSRRLWDLEFPVDAARHNLFIGGSNRRGREPPFDVEYFGASYFCGPNGRVEPRESRPELVISDLDLGELEADDPSGWNLARDARPETYTS